MAKANERFVTVYQEGTLRQRSILVDKETGVHYLYCSAGYGAGLTVLLDNQGKPIVSKSGLYE